MARLPQPCQNEIHALLRVGHELGELLAMNTRKSPYPILDTGLGPRYYSRGLCKAGAPL